VLKAKDTEADGVTLPGKQSSLKEGCY